MDGLGLIQAYIPLELRQPLKALLALRNVTIRQWITEKIREELHNAEEGILLKKKEVNANEVPKVWE